MVYTFKSKTMNNLYNSKLFDFDINMYHYSINVIDDDTNEYKLLEQDIKILRNIINENPIIYFNNLDNFKKVLNNTNIFYKTSDIYLYINNKEEYEEYKKLNIKVNLIIDNKKLYNIKPINDNITLKINNFSEYRISNIDDINFGINHIMLGDLNNNIDYISNDIYNINEYIKICDELENIIKNGYDFNRFFMMKYVYNYIARSIECDTGNSFYNYYNLIGPLINKKGSSLGFAKTFKQILDFLKIESYIATIKDKDGKIKYAWNQIKINGNWYNADVCGQSYGIHNNREWNAFLVDDKTCSFDTSFRDAHVCSKNYYVELEDKIRYNK